MTGWAMHPAVRNFNRTIYNAGTQNWSIAQHQNSWMYFANTDGLLQFDGTNWELYPISNYTNVRSVLNGSDGRLYAGAFNEFGYYRFTKNGTLEYISLIHKLAPKDVYFNEIWHIQEGGNAVYFQSGQKIFKYENDTIQTFPFKSQINFSAYVHNIYLVASETDGIFALQGNLFVKLSNSESLAGKKISGILPWQEDKILFVTESHGCFVFDGERVEPYKTDIDDFLRQNSVFCATTNGEKIAFGTIQCGLVIKTLKDNSNLFVNTYSGLQNNTILSMAFDKSNNLWLGLNKGIDYVLTDSPIYNLFGSNNLYGVGYYSLLTGTNLYLATNQGLYVTEYPLKREPVSLHLNRVKDLAGQIWSIDKIDNTLFCCSNNGVYTVSGDRATKIGNIPGSWKLKALEHHAGYILGSSYQGFFILKKTGTSWQFSHYIKGFTESGGMFEEDKDGSIWFGHWMKGISHLFLNERADSVTRIELFDHTKGLPTTQNNTICHTDDKIIFSSADGFYYYNKNPKRMERYEPMNQIFPQMISSVNLCTPGDNEYWCISGLYIKVATKPSGKIISIDSTTYTPLIRKLKMGFEHFNFIDKKNLLVSTEDGFSWIDREHKSSGNKDFKVFIRGVYLTGERDSLVAGQSGAASSSDTFSARNNSLRFKYVAPEYREERSILYSYKLDNYDDLWSAFSQADTKEYTKLGKGDYTFRVKAKNTLDSSISETAYSFTILPPWYQSRIAYAVYSLLLVLLLIALVMYVIHLSKKEALKIEIQKEQELLEQGQKYEADATEKRNEIKALKNQKLQYELRHKAMELANSTMNVIRKNEILQDISNHITNLSDEIDNDPKNVKKQLRKMQNSIKDNIKLDNNWDKFAANFDLVHEDYLKRLGEQYPELTVSDKKLCAYLKMDLSSKEIAPLLNISVRSVEMSRYRLRKKLNLNRDTNLGDYLQKF